MNTPQFLVFGVLLSLACRPKGWDEEDQLNQSGLGEDDPVDADGDGYAVEEDCDDADASVNPGALEVCNSIDDDCNGVADDGVQATFYADADGDGFGDASADTLACEAPEGFVVDATDCDDLDAGTYPDAAERCDGLDNDCDTEIDEDVQETWFTDADGDGFGDPGATVEDCDPPAGTVDNDGDCDDTDGSISPFATEVCDGVDNDCDTEIDEDDAVGASTWYFDSDSDGYGDADTSARACDQPTDFVADATDCDDAADAVNPGATEVCNDLDDDCDGDIDDADASVSGTTTWYQDYDGDGEGGNGLTADACEQPSGFVATNTDCDDTDPGTYTGATEWCDGHDDNCDGDIDEDTASDVLTWYADSDSDTYGDPLVTDTDCDQPSGYVADNTDCDDSDDTVYPTANELYDSLDNDCDGDTDEDLWIGTGADGGLSVTTDTELDSFSSGTRTVADAVSYGVAALSGSTITTNSTVGGIAAGDEVMLINLQGSDSAYAAVGTYEFASVSAVSGTSITLAEAITETYGESSNGDLSDQTIVVQRVPHYTDVAVYTGASLSMSGWDAGGTAVLAFRATGSVWVEDGGAIETNALGYAGGETGSSYNCDAYQGESYAGLGDGEGDGACTAYNESYGWWINNEGGGGAHITGAGGSHGSAGEDGDSWTGGSATAPYAGDTYGDSTLATLFYGSGGGGVWYGSSNPGPGGNGGGILYIGAGTIETEGEDALGSTGDDTPYWATGSWTYGAGGGAGGSIYLVAEEVDLADDSVAATGGDGEQSHTRLGGNGGDGRVRVECNTCNGVSQGSVSVDTALGDAIDPVPGSWDTPE